MIKAADEEYDSDTQRYLTFLMEVCHTIILGIDWFMDVNIIRELMTSQLISQQTSQRKVNLIVAQMRARSVDFNPKKVATRSKILKGIFQGSKLDICRGLSMKALGYPMYEKADPEVNYLIFAEIKPRLKAEPGMCINVVYISIWVLVSTLIILIVISIYGFTYLVSIYL